MRIQSTFTLFHCLTRSIKEELEWKRSSWHANQCLDIVVVTSTSWLVVPQCWTPSSPIPCIYYHIKHKTCWVQSSNHQTNPYPLHGMQRSCSTSVVCWCKIWCPNWAAPLSLWYFWTSPLARSFSTVTYVSKITSRYQSGKYAFEANSGNWKILSAEFRGHS